MPRNQRYKIFENDSTVANGPTTLTIDYMASRSTMQAVEAYVQSALCEGEQVSRRVVAPNGDHHFYLSQGGKEYAVPYYVVRLYDEKQRPASRGHHAPAR